MKVDLGAFDIKLSFPGLSDKGAVYAGAVIGGLLPDIDTPKSKIGKALKPLSVIINKSIGHRTFFHSLLFTALIGVFVSIFSISLGVGVVIGILINFIECHCCGSSTHSFQKRYKRCSIRNTNLQTCQIRN